METDRTYICIYVHMACGSTGRCLPDSPEAVSSAAEQLGSRVKKAAAPTCCARQHCARFPNTSSMVAAVHGYIVNTTITITISTSTTTTTTTTTTTATIVIPTNAHTNMHTYIRT